MQVETFSIQEGGSSLRLARSKIKYTSGQGGNVRSLRARSKRAYMRWWKVLPLAVPLAWLAAPSPSCFFSDSCSRFFLEHMVHC
jgi:hypothetical protein